MEIIGDDKKIRALFSEVRFADEQSASSFTSMWHRAESQALKPRRAFNLSFVTATALLVFALGSLAVWSKFSQPATQANNVFGVIPAAASINRPQSNVANAGTTESQSPKPLVKSPAVRHASQKQSLTLARNRQLADKAKQIASWTSPTASLLSSSSEDLYKSLPQLNENASDLKSFLPNSSNKEK